MAIFGALKQFARKITDFKLLSSNDTLVSDKLYKMKMIHVFENKLSLRVENQLKFHNQ